MRDRKLPNSKGTKETMPRALAALVVALVAALTLTHAPARAESQAGAAADEVGEGGLDAEVDVANADDLNAMDLVAAAVIDPRRSDKGWLHALLALLGGALAAASTARYLFG